MHRLHRTLPVLALLTLGLGLGGVAKAEAGFQFAAPNVRAPDDPKVNGMRLSFLYGENDSQAGFDVGLISVSETKTFSGASLIMGIGLVRENMTGGAAFSLINVHQGTDSGLNAAFINLLNNPSNAFNVAFITISENDTKVDFGGLNVSKSADAQLGFVNVTKELRSFQFGFVNVADNGFLPFFPIFNFPKRN